MTDRTWVSDAAESGYDTDHLPFGRWRRPDGSIEAGVRIGGYVLGAADALCATPWQSLFTSGRVEDFLAAGPRVWGKVRSALQDVLTDHAQKDKLGSKLVPAGEVEMLLPVEIGDYVDFYASVHHATNVGTLFRPGQDALLPNWRHLPVSYHGRAGTIVASGTPIVRPMGQRRAPSGPVFAPTATLDIEAELGFIVGSPSELGHPVPVEAFHDHVFGVVGVNDWSARDIQAWEYVPLGPHLGKSFATTISTWITPLSALKHASCPLPQQDPEPLAHIRDAAATGLDIHVTVEINGTVVATPEYREMYWSPAQMLAHMTSNGASVRTGDLFASGTISGPHRDQRGSLLELSWNGGEPWLLDGDERSFLLDGDEVVLRYQTSGEFDRVTLGEVRGRIRPAIGPMNPPSHEG